MELYQQLAREIQDLKEQRRCGYCTHAPGGEFYREGAVSGGPDMKACKVCGGTGKTHLTIPQQLAVMRGKATRESFPQTTPQSQQRRDLENYLQNSQDPNDLLQKMIQEVQMLKARKLCSVCCGVGSRFGPLGGRMPDGHENVCDVCGDSGYTVNKSVEEERMMYKQAAKERRGGADGKQGADCCVVQ